MLMQSSDACAITSSRNILLRGLSRFDQSLLTPHVERIAVRRDALLFPPDHKLDACYFPETALISLEEQDSRHNHIEIAMIGREGMLGWPALLGCDLSDHACVVENGGGTLLRVGIDDLRSACASSPTLWSSLLRFVQTVMVQMARAITSHLEDSLDRRIARWLLMRHDRVGGDVLLLRHEEMAARLGVRRASVTDSLHILEGEHFIRCTRGRIVVRDRATLESFAGNSYGITEAHYRSTIAPFGKSPFVNASVAIGQQL